MKIPRTRSLAFLAMAAACLGSMSFASGTTAEVAATYPASPLAGINKIQHVIIVVQENHSFDNYFGTFPGADGIPMQHGSPVVCVADPVLNQCLTPFHDANDSSIDPPHKAADATLDMAGGAMDGFLRTAVRSYPGACAQAASCRPDVSAVIGYHDAREVPVYWSYAQNFVLQDHLFAPAPSFSLPTHLSLMSGWVASCPTVDPMSCESNIESPAALLPGDLSKSPSLPYRWTDITYLLHKGGVSWAYYDGSLESASGDAAGFHANVNPMLGFQTVHDNGQTGNIKPVEQFYDAASTGRLPAVSWVVPSPALSEHPPYSLRTGQDYVAGLVDAVMQGPDWSSSAIFLTWDEWGGFYDHLAPPRIGGTQFGMRVPGIVISPYARQGYIDHQVLSFGSYLRFIEDDFLGGQRLDPKTDGRPDGRTFLSDAAPGLGNLVDDFAFEQAARPPQPVSST